jgi:predicted ATP-dependent serine protease
MTHTLFLTALLTAASFNSKHTDIMARAFSISEILSTQFELIEWSEKWETAFGKPEASGVWFVWGNSGNAKTRFLIELAKELSNTRRAFYNSLEEGKRQTMKLTLLDAGIDGTFRNLLIGQETLSEMDTRLSKRKAPRVVFIDSWQYLNARFEHFMALVSKHRNVLFIVSSHAEGKEPEGRVAKKIKYHADLKIRIEGYQAISNGRYNPGGVYTIWEQGAANYGEVTR